MMFAAQTNILTLLCDTLQQPFERHGRTPRKPANENPPGLDDPRGRLAAALADMLPSTLDEVAQAAGLEPATAQAFLAEMGARSQVMFNPLTKRYSLPRGAVESSFAA